MDSFSVCEMQYNMKYSMWISKCHQNSATRKKQHKFHFWVNYSFTVESIGHMAATPPRCDDLALHSAFRPEMAYLPRIRAPFAIGKCIKIYTAKGQIVLERAKREATQSRR